MQHIEYFGRTESREKLEEKSNVDIESLENSKTVNFSYILAMPVETNDREKGLGDPNKWSIGLEMEGGQCGLRRNSILR